MNTMTDTTELLYVTAVDSKPVQVDSWAELMGEDFEGFTYWESFDFEGADGTVRLIAQNGQAVGAVVDGELFTDWDDYADTHPGGMSEDAFGELLEVEPYLWGSEGPMMNYYYPLEGLDRSAAAALGDLPLCVVEVNGETGLALTGGGMDLSWDICKAFVRLGYLPPTHFADLPRYAGMSYDREVIAAMRRSLEVQMGWLQNRLERLNDLTD